ncbi:hypothetical protein D3C80_1160930 [compost metagenome]
MGRAAGWRSAHRSLRTAEPRRGTQPAPPQKGLHGVLHAPFWFRAPRWPIARTLGRAPASSPVRRTGGSAARLSSAQQGTTTKLAWDLHSLRQSLPPWQDVPRGHRRPPTSTGAGRGEPGNVAQAGTPHNSMNTRQRRLELSDSSRRLFAFCWPCPAVARLRKSHELHRHPDSARNPDHHRQRDGRP